MFKISLYTINTESSFHTFSKTLKFIHNHREEIRAKNIATSFLNKDFNAYYHSVNLLKGKGKNSCPVIDGHSTNKDIAD